MRGAVSLGRIGEPLDLDQFDEDHNFVASTLMDRSYATLVETWFGVPAGDLLPAPPRPCNRSRILSLRADARRAQNQCAAPSPVT